MPQLDQFTYLTQFVWLCLSFMTLYILLYKDGLPKIARILKLRSKLVSQQNQNQSGILNRSVAVSSNNAAKPEYAPEQQTVAPEELSSGFVVTENNSTNLVSTDVVIKQSLNGCASYLSASVSGASEWCNQTVTHLNNANAGTTLNMIYVKSLGDMSVSQTIKRNALDKLTALQHTQSKFENYFLLTENKVNSNTSSSVTNPLIRLNRIFMLRMGLAQKKACVSLSTTGVSGFGLKQQVNKAKTKDTDSSGKQPGAASVSGSSSLNTSRKKRSQNA